MLTLVIGGNHEASNYFWELYDIRSTVGIEAYNLPVDITEAG